MIYNSTEFRVELKKIKGKGWELGWFFDTAHYVNDRFNFFVKDFENDIKFEVGYFVDTAKTNHRHYMECLRELKDSLHSRGYKMVSNEEIGG